MTATSTVSPDEGSPAPSPTRPGQRSASYRPHLDGIRAVAVIMVILFHLGYGWIPGGFVGVDVFFVLSGYLITGLLLAEAGSGGAVRLGRFYARRARRLLPASALVIVTVLGLAMVLFDPVQRQSVATDARAAALYMANWRFATVGGDYFAPGDVPSPLVHFWSLAVEEQFYLVWPALFLVLWRRSTARGGREATGGLLAAVLAIVVASAIASVVLVPSALAYYGTHTRAYQLLAGAALAIAVRRWDLRIPDQGPIRRLGTAGCVASVAALCWLAHTIRDATQYPGLAGIEVTVASLVLIACLDRAPRGWPQRVLGHGVPAAIGRASYSLYVWHWPVIVFAPLIATRYGWSAFGSRAGMTIEMVTVALVSYLVIERPIRFRLFPAAAPRAVIATGLATSIVIGVSAIPLVAPSQPFSSRAVAAVRDLAKDGPCPYFPVDWGAPATSEPCVYRKGSGPVVAIVGDSHAQQWQPAFLEMAERSDGTIIRATRGGCPANDVTAYTLDPNGQTTADDDCAEWRHRVYPAVARMKPDVVFVATRSHVRGIRVDGRDVSPKDADHLDHWSASWDWTLRTLASTGSTVVVSEILPTLPQRVPACLLEHGPDTTRCDFAVARDRRVGPYNEVIRDLEQPSGGIRVIDPTPIPCPGGRCPAMMGDTIVHRDDNHLSATFVRSRVGLFAALLATVGVSL